jgi:MoaA/NifB/PqqE/SkfB family radical SAM enzyme
MLRRISSTDRVPVSSFTIDIELTNRCNAKCHFCPRDATPHQGLMSPEIFGQSLARAVEYREAASRALDAQIRVSLCGLGEPLLNRHAATFVGQVRAAGFDCGISSNGALLDERRGRELLDAGLQSILINVGERDEQYEEVYQLPFERTRDNVVRFAEMAGDRCEVYLVLVDHRRDAEHLAEMRDFWRGHGITRFTEYPIMNRGGALFVDHMQFDALSQQATARSMLAESGGDALCAAPFAYLFIGYDGQYYLCCSDWKKEVAFGSVFDSSFLEITGAKLDYVTARGPLCRTCNLDPLNQLTDELRARDSGELVIEDPDVMAARMVDGGRQIRAVLEQLVPGVTVDRPSPDVAGDAKRLIPVTST